MSRRNKILSRCIEHWKEIQKECADGIYGNDGEFKHYAENCPACIEWTDYDADQWDVDGLCCRKCPLRGKNKPAIEENCCDGLWIQFDRFRTASNAQEMIDYIRSVMNEKIKLLELHKCDSRIEPERKKTPRRKR